MKTYTITDEQIAQLFAKGLMIGFLLGAAIVPAVFVIGFVIGLK